MDSLVANPKAENMKNWDETLVSNHNAQSVLKFEPLLKTSLITDDFKSHWQNNLKLAVVYYV